MMVNKTNLMLALALTLTLCLVPPVVFAGCYIMEEDTCFGNAQNETFRCAIEGDGTLDAIDKAFLANVEENRIGNRWRVKAQLGRPQLRLEDISVVVTTPVTTTTHIAPDLSQDAFQLFLGWGYKWTRWATDLEFTTGEQLNYQYNDAATSPILPFPTSLNSTLRYLALFWNLEYEIPRFFDFIPNTVHPYIQGGAGVSIKSVNNDFVIAATTRSSSHDLTTFAWNAGFGVKFEITGQLLGDIAYRVVDFGEVSLGTLTGSGADPFTTIQTTAKHLKSHGVYFGITYQL